MKKIVSILILFVFSFTTLSLVSFVQAQNRMASPSPIASPNPEVSTESATPQELDRFTLFWPLVAGKTKVDSMYFLKRLKESARGLLIFGKPQKAEYEVFLATKRVLEADSLISLGKSDIASQTLDDANKNLDEAIKLMNDSKEDPGRSGVVDEVKKKLGNIDELLDFLIGIGSEPKGKIQEMKDKVNTLNNNI